MLAHPGIVPVFDVGEDEGAPFLVMEFVEGRTLADAIKKGERYTLDRVCEIGQQLADALGYAHRQGVIHRDIKPANILMTSREVYGSERPRITDFGIAKLAASEITTTGQLLGTPSFMPPEQFTGAPIDGRADLFSLGVILYSLATGEQPFPGETMTAVSYKVVYTEPIPPAKLNPAIPARLEAVILKCLAKSPADRYQTGEELAQDLAAMRTNAGAVVMQTGAPLAATAGSDVTLAPGSVATSIPPAASAKAAAQPGQKPAVKKPAKPARFETMFAVALLCVAGVGAAVAGGWFWLAHRKQPAPPQQQTVTVPVQQPQQAPPVAVAEPPSQLFHARKRAGWSARPQPQSRGKSHRQLRQNHPRPSSLLRKPLLPRRSPWPQLRLHLRPSRPLPPHPAPAPRPSIPGSSIPNKNAKLKIDVSKFPNGLPFTVEMNRQPYLHFITGDGTSLDNLYVPPGVQEFRVTFKSGGQEWDSNIVSDDFKAKKRKTLKIQLLENGKAESKITLPISKDAQLFLSFSTSLSDLF